MQGYWIINLIKIIFCDLGKKGAFSVFHNDQLIQTIPFYLTETSNQRLKNKLLAFDLVLKKHFQNIDDITCVATFMPYGLNRKTIINLAMMVTIWILHFKKIPCYLLHEWTVWKKILHQTKIPKRIEKKTLTVAWAQTTFNLKNITDDEADAILGGFYLAKYYHEIK